MNSKVMRIAEVSLSTHPQLQITTNPKAEESIQGKSLGKDKEYTLVQIELKVAATIRDQPVIIN